MPGASIHDHPKTVHPIRYVSLRLSNEAHNPYESIGCLSVMLIIHEFAWFLNMMLRIAVILYLFFGVKFMALKA